MDLSYLHLLAEQYPSIQAAATEIIALEASLTLPKETEHFLSDLHGEYEAFLHLLKSSSGSLQRRIDELFSDELPSRERRTLATLIYYPEQKLPLLLKQVEDEREWYRITLYRLIELARSVAGRYTRAHLRHCFPPDFANIMSELLLPQAVGDERRPYYQRMIDSIIETGQAAAFVIAFANLIQRLAISHLHIIGDVYDRGPGAHIIMDKLLTYHSLDIQWGNHDIVWMGAAAGSPACVANIVRLSLRYGNMETLEQGYGISLIPLASFALDVYGDDECEQFYPRLEDDPLRIDKVEETERRLLAQMQKAITIIQFKLEGQIIRRRPHYNMDDRVLIARLNLEQGTVCIDGRDYELIDTHFPTVDPADPCALTEREQTLMERLILSFATSDTLQRHVRFLFAKGGMYRIYNGNLLYHGCISLDPDGSFTAIKVDGEVYSGKSYVDRVERLARQGYFSTDPEKRLYGQDVMWYLWSGARSPLFGKNKMTTFERYFVADKETHKELQNPYYRFRDDEQTVRRILAEFGLDAESGRIINGHVPVKVRAGQSPIKAGGKLLIIDGGLAKPYQKVTGIAGYTLIANSNGLLLAEHRPFESAQKAIQDEVDVESSTVSIVTYPRRMLVKDSDRGAEIQSRLNALYELVSAYQAGMIKEA